MAAYFISDVHLGLDTREMERRKEDRLLAFFSHVRRTGSVLYIVGDLFDFWFEYRTVIPKGFHRTLAALDDLTAARIPVHYLAGNHDFWMGEFFTEELGLTVHAEPFEATIEGKRVYLHHGDGLASRDLGYRLIKPVLRNRWNIRLFRWLHPDLGVRLARGSSRSSRHYTSTKDFGEEEGMTSFAAHRIGLGADIVVMGHRHRPQMTPIAGGTYINLGDWISYNTYGRLDGEGITLETWTDTEEEHHG
jgi:UDP-2,3-diacylglucosamine hydrolase